MSRHSHPSRRHTSRRQSVWPLRLLLVLLALPGAIALTLLLWIEPAGHFLLLGGIALSAVLAIACVAAATGRLAAFLYNLTSLCVGRSGLEKIMRAGREVDHPRSLPPHKPA